MRRSAASKRSEAPTYDDKLVSQIRSSMQPCIQVNLPRRSAPHKCCESAIVQSRAFTKLCRKSSRFKFPSAPMLKQPSAGMENPAATRITASYCSPGCALSRHARRSRLLRFGHVNSVLAVTVGTIQSLSPTQRKLKHHSTTLSLSCRKLLLSRCANL